MIYKNKFFKVFLVIILLIGFVVAVAVTSIKQQESEAGRIPVSGINVKDPFVTKIQENKQGDVVFGKNPDFEIIFLPKFEEFLISINGSPFEEKRQKAEEELLGKLSISQEEACKLNVRIITPRHINPQESQQDYKLSFCQ